MKDRKRLVPKRRFKEFENDEEWRQRTLGELGSVAMNKRIFQNQTSEIGDIPFYKIGTFGKKPDAYIPRDLFEEYKKKYSYPGIGDILISASGSIGRTVEFTGEDEYFQDSNIVWLKHDGRIKNLFLKQFYKIVDWQGLEGSTIKRLYNKNILDTQINLPSLEEQTKIGQFFQQLDNLISLQQEKIRKTKALKSAYLSDMFPKEGESTPKLRFAGFKKPWSKIRLGDKYMFLKGKGLPLKSFFKGKERPSIAYGHLYTKYAEVIDEVNLSSKGNGILSRYGDLLFPGSSTVPNGTAQSNAILLDDVQLGWDIIIARPLLNDVDSAFFTYHINSKKEKLCPITVGTTITHMYGRDLENIKYFMPAIKEQTKIGQFFQQLDKQITLHEKKLEKLENLKKAYLNEMFV